MSPFSHDRYQQAIGSPPTPVYTRSAWDEPQRQRCMKLRYLASVHWASARLKRAERLAGEGADVKAPEAALHPPA